MKVPKQTGETELIHNDGDQFSRENVLQATYSFLTVLPQTEDFNLGTDTIHRRNILWKIKVQFFILDLVLIYEAMHQGFQEF